MNAIRSTVIIESNPDPKGPPRVALCAHCAKQREAEPSGVELAPSHLGIVSGCCHDCGGGWCECRGRLSCDDYCPRKNSPVVLAGLTLYVVVIPPPPSTVPSPL